MWATTPQSRHEVSDRWSGRGAACNGEVGVRFTLVELNINFVRKMSRLATLTEMGG